MRGQVRRFGHRSVTSRLIFTVPPGETRATGLIDRELTEAERYAEDLSNDPGVLAAGVTRFVLGKLGTRTPVAPYVRGVRQPVPYVSDDRMIHAGGAAYTPGRHR
jgi:hypothetical protein